MALHSYFVYAGADSSSLGALECFLAGAMFPNQRIAAFGPQSLCPHCGQPQSLLHLIWQCTHTMQIDNKYIRDTNALADQAVRDTGNLAFWTRGLLPDDLIQILPPDEPLETYILSFHTSYNKLEQNTWPSGIYSGDGSGGKFTSHPQLRRCGIGICQVVDGEITSGASVTLPGKRQTVGRAELFALLIVALNAVVDAVITSS